MWLTFVIAALLALLLSTNKRYLWLYIIYQTFWRDLSAMYKFLRLNLQIWQWEREQATAATIFQNVCKKNPHKIAFYFEDEKWTFYELEEFSNRVANYFKSQGYKKGDTVALLLENRPEYVGIWLGLSKLGVITALINTNLRNDPLFFCIDVANSKAVIFGQDFCEAIKSIHPKIDKLKLYQFNEKAKRNTAIFEGASDLIKELDNTSNESIENTREKFGPKDKLCYIYTSGTTGLPKAAVINNMRFMFMSAGMTYMIGVKQNDLIYNPLPLYHSAGGMVGAGQTVLQGVPMCLRKKFSASNYWKDCAKYKCTIGQYIGEICRYILSAHGNQPPPKHNVRIMFGNGCKAQIWEKFVKLFNVKMVEFYGATEGNSNLVNFDGTLGAVGFVPRYASLVYPVTLIRCNEETGEPIRNSEGFCTKCKVGEAGILIGKINPKKTVFAFSGYADKKATAKKVMENVFEKGDMYFNSGDILVQDLLGYYYFKDRTGDTFRWKGENVATCEIESIISSVLDNKDAVVYGVEIPETEGRAGMAAIVDSNKTLDLDNLLKGLKANLPSYAVPIFIRSLSSLELTGTFKIKKTDLQKEGFNINSTKDEIYYLDARNSKYIPLTKDIYDKIMNGTMKL